MPREPHTSSQPLLRGAFIAYFLGAVLPLLALAYLAQSHAIASLADESTYVAIAASVAGLALLSLASFAVLRRATRQTLARIGRDNEGLSELLRMSEAFSRAPHSREVMRIAAEGALRLTDARAAYFLASREKGGPLELIESAGEDAIQIYAGQREAFDEMAKLAAAHLRPVLRGAGQLPPAGEGRGARSATAVPIAARRGAAGVLLALSESPRSASEELRSFSTLAGLAAVALHNGELQDQQRNFFTHVTEILVGALDAHLDYHSGHALRVAHVSIRVGRSLGFDEERLQRLHFTGLLHDLGMLKIEPDQHSNRKAVQRHPALGYRMLHRIKLWEDLAPFVLHHHEWWNGQGYPEGLAGEAIPLEARIIGLAEAFDSMTSANSYKQAIPVAEALERIQAAAGTQFDPELSRVFLELARRGELDTSPAD